MGFKQEGGLRYYQFESLKSQPLYHAILTRQGGSSKEPFDSLNTGGTVGDDPEHVLMNHQRIYEVLGFDYHSRFDVWQVHGTEVVCTDHARSPNTPHVKADGILTANKNVTLFMRFADCVPILIFDPVHEVIGIIHAGWQGTAQEIVKAAVKKMGQCYRSEPEMLIAGIGPSICQKCYEVGEDVYQAFIQRIGSQAEKFFLKKRNRIYLDLWKANYSSLKQSGIKQIEISGICTACHLEDWYSHRAEQGKTGRFGVLMALKA